MSSVTHYGHGVYCYACQAVYENTDGCEHGLDKKAGVQKTRDGYAAQPNDMGHHGPHWFIEVDGMEMCAECEHVKIPDEMMGNVRAKHTGRFHEEAEEACR